jgi:hypothetical protein
MPRPRLFTDAQEDAALAQLRAENGARGAMSRLAAAHNVSFPGMTSIIERAKGREEAKVSRETLKAAEPQP